LLLWFKNDSPSMAVLWLLLPLSPVVASVALPELQFRF